MYKPPADRYVARARFVASIARHGLSADATYDLTRDYDAAVSVEEAKMRGTRPEWMVAEEARTAVWDDVQGELAASYREQVARLSEAAVDALAGMRVVGEARRAGRKTVRLADVYVAVAARRAASHDVDATSPPTQGGLY